MSKKRRKRRHNPSRRHRAYGRIRRRNQLANPHRYYARRRYGRRRSGNPSFGGMSTNDLLWMGAGAAGNGVLARLIPSMFLPQYNVGFTGYGLNVAAGSLLAWLAGKFNRRLGQCAWVGLFASVAQRFFAERFGSGPAAASAGMSGDLDFYLNDAFPLAQGAAGGPYGMFPGTPYAPALPAATAAARVRTTVGPASAVNVGPASGGGSPATWGDSWS